MKYKWRATYKDGSIHERGLHSYKLIRQDELEYFEIVNCDTGNVSLKIKFNKNQRLIWRIRTVQVVGKEHQLVHLVGKQETIDGKNYQSLFLLYEDDSSVEAFERFDDKHPFLNKVEFLDFEQWEQ